jgi:Lrp/AsnC family transcriptional regulator for asnA, asnC and gidA
MFWKSSLNACPSSYAGGFEQVLDGQTRGSTAAQIRGGIMKKNNRQIRKKGIDQIDCRMIELLQKDGRLSNTEIAKKLGFSEATVRTRLQRLIQEEYIQIVAVSNPLKLGFEAVGTIRIHVDINKMDKIIRELKGIRALWHIVQSTGGTGIDTEFVLKDLNELNKLIFEKINRIDGVLRTETSLFLNYVKRQYDWGTALE